MRNGLKLMGCGLTLTRRDPMLMMLLMVPWLAGAALGLGLPFLAPVLLTVLKFDITPWYDAADTLMLMLAPMMAGTLAGFLMLDERDERVGEYYTVTPIGGARYLFSRLALPVLWGIVVSPLLMLVFSLSHLTIPRILAIAGIGGLFASVMALLLMAFAGNKVEGLAVSKMMGLTMLPVIVPFLTSSPWGMLAGIFPAYWMGAAVRGPVWMALPGIAVSAAWLWVLYRRTVRRRG